MKDKKRLWSKRNTVARGLIWQHERDCNPETADQWLALYQKDEPDIEFQFSDKRPKI